MAVMVDVPTKTFLVSGALSAHLEKEGLWDIQELLGGQLGVRTLRCFAHLTQDEFQVVCDAVLRESFGPGHVCSLRLLRASLSAAQSISSSPGASCMSDEQRALHTGEKSVKPAPSEPQQPEEVVDVFADIQQEATPEWYSNPDHDLPSDIDVPLESESARQPEEDIFTNMQQNETPAQSANPEQVLISKIDVAIASLHEANSNASSPDSSQHLLHAIQLCTSIRSSLMSASSCNAARALTCVEAAQSTSSARRHVQDVLVMCCCRHIEPRNKAAFKEAVTQAYDGRVPPDSFARLGNSRYQLYERNVEAEILLPPGLTAISSSTQTGHESRCSEYAQRLALPQMMPDGTYNIFVLDAILSKVCDDLRRPLERCWSEPELEEGADSAGTEGRTEDLSLLQNLRCFWESEKQFMDGAIAWVQNVEGETGAEMLRDMQKRFLLVGVLFGVGDAVAKPLLDALKDGMAKCTFDEYLIASALRAIIELNALECLPMNLKGEILASLLDEKFQPQKQFCHSAYIGVIATFAVDPLSAQLQVVDQICETATYWLSQYGAESVIYEAMWALNLLVDRTHVANNMKMSVACHELVTKVLADPFFLKYKESSSRRDAGRAWQGAETLSRKLLFEPQSLEIASHTVPSSSSCEGYSAHCSS